MKTSTLHNTSPSLLQVIEQLTPWTNLPAYVAPQHQGLGLVAFFQKHLPQLLWFTFCLNVMDGLMTIFWVSTKLAIEANPMMDVLLEIHPMLFLLGKVGLVTGGLFILAQRRNKSVAVIGIVFVFAIYTLIMTYHMMGLSLLSMALLLS